MDFRDTDAATDAAETTVEVPPPDEASPADVDRYTKEFLEHNDIEANAGGGRTDPEESPFAKQDGDAFGEGVKHRTEFPWLYDPSRGVRWDFDPIELRNIAQPNTWVGMLVGSITKEIAETPWTIVESDGRAETQKRLSTHPEERDPIEKDLPDATSERIYDTLMHPNPDETWHDVCEQWYADLLEVGSMTAVKAFSQNAYQDDELVADASVIEPRAIQASAPEVWTKEFHKSGITRGFWQFENHNAPGSGHTDGRSASVRGVRDPTFFDTDEVMWADHSPRTNRRYGIPPTLIVKDFLQSVDLAITQEQQYLSRGSIPSGAWIFENWDREQMIERKQEMTENVSGKPHKSLMFAGEGGDVRFEPMSMNFSELEFTERMKWYARVIASAFQVPTAVVGIEPERVNYNTFQGERENFESNTLGPYLQKGERWITHNLIRPHWGDDYRFEFKPGMSESTRGMISERVRSEFDANVRTRNEARREMGLDPVDEDGFKDDVVEDSGDGGPFDDVELSVSKDSDGTPNFGLDNGHQLVGEEAEGNSHSTDDGTIFCQNEGKSYAGERLSDAYECPMCEEAVIEGDDLEKDSDEPLRETDEWYLFDVQPGEVDALQSEIADDVRELYDSVLSDDEIQDLIERLAADETEKSTTELARHLQEALASLDVAERIADAIREHTADEIAETVDDAAAGADADVDVDAIRARLSDRDVGFANEFADRMAEDIRETVGDGWAEGRSSREIAADIADQGDIAEGWQGAERIARQELHTAAGEARSAVAADIGKVEVWEAAGGPSGDGRNRDPHLEMHGKWKRPGEEWEVDYGDRGVQKESVPGDSEPGIGCRCVTLLRDRDEVDEGDHAGV